MISGRALCVVIAMSITWPAGAATTDELEYGLPGQSAMRDRADGENDGGPSAAARLHGAIREPEMHRLAGEILERNPGVAAASARARAAALEAPRVRSLPDPVASLTAFVASPETRTGPQVAALGISQGLPWFGTLALREQGALLAAAAQEAESEALRLARVTEGRRLFYELAFLGRYEEISRDFLTHLSQHEEIARSRYSTGIGPGQGVIKLQAEITRVESELLEIERRRASLLSQLDGLRDRPTGFEAVRPELPAVSEVRFEVEDLVEVALAARPEIVAAQSRVAHAAVASRLAEKGYRPGFRVGLSWTVVDARNDTAGRLQPPEGNGDDILGIQGGITLPIWRKKLDAGVEQAAELEIAAADARRDVANRIRAAIGDLAQSVPLSWRRLRLVEDLLIVQAEEALESAQSGYVAGVLNALDLYDAEHVLYEARTARARATADYLIGIARLEGAIAGPLEGPRHNDATPMERSES